MSHISSLHLCPLLVFPSSYCRIERRALAFPFFALSAEADVGPTPGHTPCTRRCIVRGALSLGNRHYLANSPQQFHAEKRGECVRVSQQGSSQQLNSGWAGRRGRLSCQGSLVCIDRVDFFDGRVGPLHSGKTFLLLLHTRKYFSVE